jgi:hypothetical protein
MTPNSLTFPGLGGPVDACVEQRDGARGAVIVVADPDDTGAAAEDLRGALVEAGFIVAWIPRSHLDATSGIPRVEDLAALVGTLSVSSHATVGLVARGRSSDVALTTVEGAYDLVAVAVLVDAPDDVGDPTAKGTVPIIRLDTSAPDAVVKALARHLDAPADDKSRNG